MTRIVLAFLALAAAAIFLRRRSYPLTPDERELINDKDVGFTWLRNPDGTLTTRSNLDIVGMPTTYFGNGPMPTWRTFRTRWTTPLTLPYRGDIA